MMRVCARTSPRCTAANDQFDVRIRITPGRDESVLARISELISRRTAQVVTFQEKATIDSDGVMRVERDIVTELAPGAYSVEVTITNPASGVSLTGSTQLVIVESNR